VSITSFWLISKKIAASSFKKKQKKNKKKNNCGRITKMPGMNEAKCANNQPQPHCSSRREREDVGKKN
jgi:hypothetical protein